MIEIIAKKWFDDNIINNISVVSSVLTILSFVLTIWVLIQTRSIKNFYKKHVRVKDVANELSESIKSVGAILRKKNNIDYNELGASFSIIHGKLSVLCNKVDKKQKKKIRCYLDKNKHGIKWDNCMSWDAYNDLCQIDEEIKGFVKDHQNL
jgi:hypothetical protein